MGFGLVFVGTHLGASSGLRSALRVGGCEIYIHHRRQIEQVECEDVIRCHAPCPSTIYRDSCPPLVCCLNHTTMGIYARNAPTGPASASSHMQACPKVTMRVH